MALETTSIAAYVNPFVQSVSDFFEKMLGTQAHMGQVAIGKDAGTTRTIMGVIGFNGPIKGTVALILPVYAARAIVGKLLERDVPIHDQSLADGISQLVNLIAGQAKARFPHASETPLRLAIPIVIRGKSFSVESVSQSVWLEIAFQCEYGPFILRISLEPQLIENDP